MKISDLLEGEVIPFKNKSDNKINQIKQDNNSDLEDTYDANSEENIDQEEIDDFMYQMSGMEPWYYYLGDGDLITYKNKLAQIVKTSKDRLVIVFDADRKKMVVNRKDPNLSIAMHQTINPED